MRASPCGATHIDEDAFSLRTASEGGPYYPKKTGGKWRGKPAGKPASTRATLPYAHDTRESRRWRSGRWLHGADLHIADEIWE
jgi:hypothetical protein